MDPRKLPVDARLKGLCAYCGGAPDSTDHVPPRVMLDEPYPEPARTVDACMSCNNEVSNDERYVACLVECILAGTTVPHELSRPRIANTLAISPALAAAISSSRTTALNGAITWRPDMECVCRVFKKLARGHAFYELHVQLSHEPDLLWAIPLSLMTEAEQATFAADDSGKEAMWPEFGSRAFMRAVAAGAPIASWQVVQAGRYRYRVKQNGGLAVHIVMSEYLAGCVEWH